MGLCEALRRLCEANASRTGCDTGPVMVTLPLRSCSTAVVNTEGVLRLRVSCPLRICSQTPLGSLGVRRGSACGKGQSDAPKRSG